MNVYNPQSFQAPATDDAWMPSSCALCYGTCSILAHRVDGVVVKIEGNPESAVGKGRLCGKGVSGLMTHYDPNRLRYPMRRTNPRKGLNEDPGWKRISWEEALGEIAEVLREVHKDDPRKLVVQRTTTVTASRVPLHAFATAFGTPNFSVSGGGQHCGNGAHLISGIMHASWSVVPDFEHCNYAIFFGASKGHSAGHASCSNMGKAADARARGMRMVVVDPLCNFAAAKATEWVPLRVGTDAALALAMCNVIVNELGTYDGPYLQARTNAPYLIGPDQLYVRDPGSKKPLVWDNRSSSAKPFDEVPAADMAIEGEFQIGATPCRPAFQCLREHLRQFTPQWAETICDVRAAAIRRLAKEFATEARIGSTIMIEGIVLPYRPVAAIAFRGSQGHRNSVYNFYAVDLLNQLVGAADVVGGCLGFNPACHGHPETGKLRYMPNAGPDGLMMVGSWMGYHYPYPPAEPRPPRNLGLHDLFVIGMTSPFLDSSDSEAMWEKLGIDYRPEVMINFGANLVMSIANKDAVAASLSRYKFIVSFDLFLTETSNFVDIVLPDCGYLQSLDSRSNFPFIFSLPAGLGEWCWPIRQPVLPPDGEQRQFAEVLLELADRVGIRADLNAAYNAWLDLQPPYRLVGDTPYSYEDICDRELKNNFGPENGLDWFKQHGIIKWKKTPQEVYWRPFVDVRVPVYWEFLKPIGDKIAAIAEPRGFAVPQEYYHPLPSFLPCRSHCCDKPGFDFYGFYYRDIVHTNSFTMENPWLDEAARLDPFSYTIAMNRSEAGKRGLADGQLVAVESETGRQVTGRLKLTEGIHPEGLGFAAMCGHWTDGQPIAKGKGVFYNDLLEIDWEHASPVNINLDLCVKVRVTPVERVS
jgi:molybdopterin-containing oxidoreductase family molybdopterin binding subunit